MRYADWLTSDEAAAYPQAHVETMRRWARMGVTPAVQLGNRGGFRFGREDLDRFPEVRPSGAGTWPR